MTMAKQRMRARSHPQSYRPSELMAPFGRFLRACALGGILDNFCSSCNQNAKYRIELLQAITRLSLMNPPPNCPRCGSVLHYQASGGLCPQCLLICGLLSTHPGNAPRFDPPEPEELAPLFPELEILELIGHGGMGVVYRARQTALDRIVALKILPVELEADTARREHFLQEARSLAKLNHPGIVRVFDGGESNGIFYLIMEHVDGQDLACRLLAGRPALEESIGIVRQLCEALSFAHGMGVVHRDIKPSNILLTAEGKVKLADFGIAKLLDAENVAQRHATAGDALGTPLYMAPEQRDQPENVDERADIYALGVVFYELLTGELPTGSFPKPSELGLSPEVDDPVLKALQPDPGRRYQSANDFRAAVDSFDSAITDDPAKHPPYSAQGDKRRSARMALIIAAMTLVVAIFSWWFYLLPSPPRDLFEAAHRGDIKAAEQFIAKGAKVDAPNQDGLVPLLGAASRARPGTVELLLKHRADPNGASSKSGISPLTAALNHSIDRREDVLRVVDLLLAHGANPDGVAGSAGSPSSPAKSDRFAQSPLLFAVALLDVDLVKKLLEHGAEATLRNPNGRTLLHQTGSAGGTTRESAEKSTEALLKEPQENELVLENLRLLKTMGPIVQSRDAAPVIKLLLKHGLKLEDKEQHLGMTALNVAAWEGKSNVVNALLDQGADIESTDNAGFTPLLSAIEMGHSETVELLLRRGASIHATDVRGTDALGMIADKVQFGDDGVRMARMLMDQGLSADPKSKELSSPLMAASGAGYPKMVAFLLESGADPNRQMEVPGRVHDGVTPLHWAAQGPEGRKRNQKLRDPSSLKPGIGGPNLPMGAEADFVEATRLLLEAGADVKASKASKVTPLHMAAEGDAAAIIELLLKHGAEIEAADSGGRTPLLYAVNAGSKKALRVLAQHKARLQPAPYRTGAVHIVTTTEDHDTAKILSDLGANWGSPDARGATPLHLVKSAEMARFLIEHGADAHAWDAFGSQPLHLAAGRGLEQVANVLLEAKADPSSLNIQGLTAGSIANLSGHKKLGAKLNALVAEFDQVAAGRLEELVKLTPPLIGLQPTWAKPEAEPLVREEISIIEKLSGDAGHPAVALSRGILGLVLRQTGRFTEAVPHLDAALKTLNQRPQKELNPLYLALLREMAEACRSTSDTEAELQALRDLRSAVAKGTLPIATGEEFLVITSDIRKPADPLDLAELDREIGLALLKLDRAEEAEPLLRAAFKVVQAAHGDSHASVVAIQDALETIARKKGQPTRPRFVGGFARTDKISFEGNRTFKAEELRAGLLSSPDYLLASHPVNAFDDYLKTLVDCLTRGYQQAGFPDPRISVDYDSKQDAILARIEEGKRYRWATLKVVGAETIGDEVVLSRLNSDSVTDVIVTDDSFGGRLSAAVASPMTPLGFTQPASPTAGNTPQQLPVIVSSSKFSDFWKAGDFASFGKQAENGIASAAATALAQEGFFQSKITVKHLTDPDGLGVNTTLEVIEGPRAVLKQIELTGNKSFTKQAVLKMLGVSEGMEVRLGLKSEIENKFARSLRFIGWTVNLMQSALGSPDMNLHLNVKEVPDAPPLDQPLTADEQEYVRIAEWLTMFDKGEKAIRMTSIEKNSGSDVQIIWSKSGISVMFRAKNESQDGKKLAITLQDNRLAALWGDNATPRFIQTTLNVQKIQVFLRLLSDLDEVGKHNGGITFGAGFGNSSSSDGLVAVRLCVAPTEILRIAKQPDARVERSKGPGGETILTIESRLGLLRWDVGRGQLIEASLRESNDPEHRALVTASVLSESEAAQQLESQLPRDLTNAEGGIREWAEFIHTLPPTTSLLEGVATAAQVDAAALALHLASDSIDKFRGKFFNLSEKSEFFVPVDLQKLNAINPTAAMFAGLWFHVTDWLLPQETWLWELGRELFYIYAGRTEHTSVNLSRIAHSPELGPCGCLFTAGLLDKLQIPQAGRFRQLAWQKLTLEGFQRDWRLVMESPSELRHVLNDVLNKLRALDQTGVELMASLMERDDGNALIDAIKHLKANPDAPHATLLWPLAERYWHKTLEKSLRSSLINTPGIQAADPKVVAARVNGVDILWKQVSQVEAAQAQVLRFQLQSQPAELQKQLETLKATAVNSCIERELLLQAFRRTGGKVDPAYIDQDIRTVVSSSFGGNEADLRAELERQGMTFADFRALRETTIITQGMGEQITAGVRPPSNAELLRLYEKESLALAGHRMRHLHTLTLPLFGTEEKRSTADAQRKLAREIKEKAISGSDFTQLARTYSQDSRAAEGGSMGMIDPAKLPAQIQNIVNSLKPGEVSEPVELEANIVLLWVKEDQQAVAPPFDQVKSKLEEQWLGEKRREAMKQWMENQRALSNIERFSPSNAPPE
jgi:serine/threonine protein kinase/ankyrin repeat protein